MLLFFLFPFLTLEVLFRERIRDLLVHLAAGALRQQPQHGVVQPTEVAKVGGADVGWEGAGRVDAAGDAAGKGKSTLEGGVVGNLVSV